jgi:hypothetical protein
MDPRYARARARLTAGVGWARRARELDDADQVRRAATACDGHNGSDKRGGGSLNRVSGARTGPQVAA